MRTAGLIALFLIASPALAQKAPAPAQSESEQDMVGTWELSNAERNKTCTATFKNTRSPVGWRLEFDKNCAAVFPVIASAAGWTFPDGDLLRLIDAEGRTLTEFSEVEDGIYEAPTPGIGVLFLQNPEAAARKPEDTPEPERIEDPGAK
jgi:protease inhibitor Inh